MITPLGRTTISVVTYFGKLGLLAVEILKAMFVAPVRWRLVLRQVAEIGTGSQLVVSVTGVFTGAVLAAQMYFQFHRLGLDSGVGSIVSLAMFRELGPVLTGLMVTGRCGAAIAAEIGTMKVTEQVDALRSLGVHPIDYLVVPRSVAMMISMPLLVAECCLFALLSSYFVGVVTLLIPEAFYMHNLDFYTKGSDVAMALIKAFFFAIIIALVSCHEGLETENGAAGVGRAPTVAVVIASLSILGINLILTFALNIIFPSGQ